MIHQETPLSHLLSSPYVDHICSTHDGEWVVTAIVDDAFIINEVTDNGVGLYVGGLEKGLYSSRATTVGELIQIAIDNDVRNSFAVIEELALVLLKGRRVYVPKDDGLLVGVEVGVEEGREEGFPFVCSEYPRGTRLPAHHKFDVMTEGKFGFYYQHKKEDDFSAFGAVWKLG